MSCIRHRNRWDMIRIPNETVTGSQAAKMLLVAAGYQSAIEGFTGANWEVNTNVRANAVGLYDGLDINPSQGAPARATTKSASS